jgi:hypothetical protein
LPVANIHGVVDALASINPRYTSHTYGLNLSKPVGGLPFATNVGGFPAPSGSA